MSSPDLIDWVIIKKGGPGSGHWHHAGRPGRRGGSMPKGAMDIPAAFGGNRERFEAALAEYVGEVPHAWHAISNRMKWQLDRQPEDKSYEASFTVDSLYRKYFSDTPAYAQMEKRRSDTFWEEYHALRQEAAPKFTISREEYRALYEVAKARWELRAREIRQDLGLPENVDDLLPPEAYQLGVELRSDDPAKKAQWERLNQRFDTRARQAIAQADTMEFGSDEIGGVLDTYFNQLGEKYGVNPDSLQKTDPPDYQQAREWLWSFSRNLDEAADFQANSRFCSGELGLDELRKKGYRLEGSEDAWKPLPKEVYHVTTNAGAVLASGIQSRYELGIWSGPGLGGGSSTTISFSNDLQIAREIERTIHEGQLVASGQITATQMVQWAAEGRGSVGHNWGYMATHEGWDHQPKEGDEYDPVLDPTILRSVRNLLDYEAGKPVRDYWNNVDWTPEKYRDAMWSFYQNYMWARQAAGGFTNALFFSTDYKKLGRMDPKEFKTLVYRPKNARVRGEQMSSLSEWRIVGRDAVKLSKTYDFFDPDDPDFLNKIIG